MLPGRRLIALLMLMLLLTGCLPVRAASKQADGPRATAAIEGTGVRFTLSGYEVKGQLPELKVTGEDGFDWSTLVLSPERDGTTVSAKLPGDRGTARLAVENLTYSWFLPGGQVVSGKIQFRDSRFKDLEWTTDRTQKLLIYHVRPLSKKTADRWEQALELVLKWSGQKRTEPLVIWVFPDNQTLNEWARTNDDFRVAGEWLGDVERLVVADENDSTERQVVMLHEMVHAVTPGQGPAWFEEGIARLFESREEKALDGEAAFRWNIQKRKLAALQAEARRRPIEVTEAQPSRSAPLDPYTVGVSVWMYVRRKSGETGLKRFLAQGGGENGVKLTLEAMFEKPLPDIWADWNEYLRSPALLEDYENP